MAISKRVGHVAALWRYPVKSMAAEALEHADVSWHGIPGDLASAVMMSFPTRPPPRPAARNGG